MGPRITQTTTSTETGAAEQQRSAITITFAPFIYIRVKCQFWRIGVFNWKMLRPCTRWLHRLLHPNRNGTQQDSSIPIEHMIYVGHVPLYVHLIPPLPVLCPGNHFSINNCTISSFSHRASESRKKSATTQRLLRWSWTTAGNQLANPESRYVRNARWSLFILVFTGDRKSIWYSIRSRISCTFRISCYCFSNSALHRLLDCIHDN